jgi:hypothetical protein
VDAAAKHTSRLNNARSTYRGHLPDAFACGAQQQILVTRIHTKAIAVEIMKMLKLGVATIAWCCPVSGLSAHLSEGRCAPEP